MKMKKIVFLNIGFLLQIWMAIVSGQNNVYNYSHEADSVLKLMTLDEKIGQMVLV